MYQQKLPKATITIRPPICGASATEPPANLHHTEMRQMIMYVYDPIFLVILDTIF